MLNCFMLHALWLFCFVLFSFSFSSHRCERILWILFTDQDFWTWSLPLYPSAYSIIQSMTTSTLDTLLWITFRWLSSVIFQMFSLSSSWSWYDLFSHLCMWIFFWRKQHVNRVFENLFFVCHTYNLAYTFRETAFFLYDLCNLCFAKNYALVACTIYPQFVYN